MSVEGALSPCRPHEPIWLREGGRPFNITSAKLHYFIMVAREGNFTKAAHLLYMTQPALSQQVKALERELGTELFDRAHGRVCLTERGRVFLPYAQRILELLEAAVEATREGVFLLETGPTRQAVARRDGCTNRRSRDAP